MSEEKSPLWGNIKIAASAVALLWVIYFLNNFFPLIDFRSFGIAPRSLFGLIGIPCAPFLHASLPHLISNSGPLLVLLAVCLSINRLMTLEAIVMIAVLGGGMVWIFGAPRTVHIGASGVIFGLIGFLMFLGIFQKKWKTLIASVIVFFAYGGTLFSLFMFKPGVSWSSHFWGFGAGIVTAWWMRDVVYKD